MHAEPRYNRDLNGIVYVHEAYFSHKTAHMRVQYTP